MTSASPDKGNAPQSETGFWDYLRILLDNRWMIIRNCGIFFVVAVLISLLLPKKYTATATLLPPEQTSSSNPLNGISNDLLPGFAFLNANTSADLFVQILQSRSVQQAVLNRTYQLEADSITLMDYFDATTLENAIEQLNDVTAIKALKEGIITISVELGSPDLAASVANAYIEELDSVNQSKSTSKAKNSRLYIENQLELTKERLNRADQALADFMQTQKAIALEEQTRAAIEESGELKGRIIAKEVELAMKLRVRKANHEEVLALRAELDELRKQYNKLQYGASKPSNEDKREFYIPLVKVPDVSLHLTELLRELKVQETVFNLLNQQYYQAKIQEAKDTPTIQVLDEAVPPSIKSKPQRMLIVFLVVGSIFILSLALIFIREFLNRIKQDRANKKEFEWILNTLKDDWNKIRKFITSLKLP